MRFTVVIPTYQRRDTLLRTVASLEHQVFRDFETIVVSDGSTDGTVAALRAQHTSFPLTVLEQPNAGAGKARNVGAAVAAGELLLFLDDDMDADPALLREHDASHRAGADLVIGDLPLHPGAPRTLLSRGVATWARSRRDRLSEAGEDIPLADMLTGQMSVARQVFERLGGFDARFTRDGLFGGEDIDFGYRVLKAGYRVVFNPAAISYQYYDVDPYDFLRRAYEAGRSGEELAVKHPERARQLSAGPELNTKTARWLLGPLIMAPGAVSRPLRAGVASLVRRGHTGPRLTATFFALRAMERRRGARDARRAYSTGAVVVLAFHAISDLRDDSILGDYGTPRARFGEHLDALARKGWTFIDLDRLLRALDGEEAVPRRAVLVTFDDGYADLVSDAAPVLDERGIPALAFAVAGLVGRTNEWDQQKGARAVGLATSDDLLTLRAQRIEIGAHSYSHRALARVGPDELADEIERCAERLEGLGLPRPRALSYPYGSWNSEVAAQVSRSGYAAAFTVDPGVVTRSTPR